MNSAAGIAEFLATRRAKLTPEQVGLPSYGQRRVAGLRREEVAALAGVSADYYRRLERGQVTGVSEQVLEALARALQLDDAERTHLFDLIRATSPVARRRARPAGRRIRPIVQRLLDQIQAPAIVATPAPPGRRRPGPQLRDAHPRRRRRPRHVAVHRRGGVALPAGTGRARQLDGDV